MTDRIVLTLDIAPEHADALPGLLGVEPGERQAHTLPSDLFNDLAGAQPFTFVFDRQSWRVSRDETTVAVTLDRGFAIAGERQSPFCEIELALEDGAPAALFSLARQLARQMPARLGVASRQGRGRRLVEAMAQSFRSEQPPLQGGMKAAEAFRAIAGTCLRQFRLNETILTDGRANAEAVHQARVGLRRLRSAFKLYKPCLASAESLRLKGELKWLAGELGAVRDLDVLAAKVEHEGIRARLHELRAAAFVRLAGHLGSERGRLLSIDLAIWLIESEDFQAPCPPAAEFATEALRRWRKRLRKHGETLADLDDAHRHEARKDAKVLRYAGEFFAPLFADKRGQRRYRAFTAAMEDLQDKLGALNDLATADALLESLGLTDLPGTEALIAKGDRAELIEEAQLALEDVIDAKRFWR